MVRGPLGAYPRHTRLHWTRREILTGIAATAALSLVPWAKRAHAVLPLQLLHGPVILTSGSPTCIGHRYLIADDFNANSPGIGGVIDIADIANAVVQDVSIIGPDRFQQRWLTDVETRPYALGLTGANAGIVARSTDALRIERVQISGIPRAGIDGWGWPDGILRDFTIEHCYNGIRLRTGPSSGVLDLSPRLLLERVAVRNSWGPGPGHWAGIGGTPSKLQYAGSVGGTAIAISGMDDSTIRGCTIFGEHFTGLKISVCDNVLIEDCEAAKYQIASEATNVVIRNCAIDRRLGYYTSDPDEFSNGMQGTNENAVGAPATDFEVDSCQFINLDNEPAGDAINLGTTNITANVHDSFFSGWNGFEDRDSYAIASATGNCFNSDFDSGAGNVFVNQSHKSIQFGTSLCPSGPPSELCSPDHVIPCVIE